MMLQPAIQKRCNQFRLNLNRERKRENQIHTDATEKSYYPINEEEEEKKKHYTICTHLVRKSVIKLQHKKSCSFWTEIVY